MRNHKLSPLPSRPPIPVGDVHFDEWVAPDITDAQGLLQAGKLLEWMDVIGVIAATRHCRSPVVTAAVDGMELREPIRLGDRVTMSARLAYTSAHSVGVSIKTVHGESPRPTLEAYMTFVPLDKRGRPQAAPPFQPETPADVAHFREGRLRQEFRRRLERGEMRPRADALPADVEPKEWPLLVREWMKQLPRYLRLPWERPSDPLRARDRSYIHKIEPVRMANLNFHGTLYGGTLMRWSEDAARLSAGAFLNGAQVRCTGLHGLTFLQPVPCDRFVHVRAVVVHTAHPTLTTLVSVHSEDPVGGEQLENLRAFMTYAPLDSSVRVAEVVCQSDDDRALFDEVAERLALQRAIFAGDGEAAPAGSHRAA